MSITLHPDGRVTGSGAANFGSSGQVIQTVFGTNCESVGTSSVNISGSVSSPTFFDSNGKVTISPKRSNSKIMLTWTAQVRINSASYGYVGVFYSSSSDMSSPTTVEKYRGSSFNKSYRTVQSGSYDFSVVTNVAWDETITNTTTRYYNVGGYAASGNIYYGDHGTALQLIAQEIAI